MGVLGVVAPTGIVLIGYKYGLDLNSTADQAIPLSFRGRAWAMAGSATTAGGFSVLFTNVGGGSAALAVGGVYTGAGKTGSQIAVSTTAFSALAASTDALRAVGNASSFQRTFNNTVIYLSLGTAAGVACTCDAYVFGLVLP